MVTLGKWIARHRILILIIGIALLVPSALGYLNTRTNFDLLTYLPESLETVEGQNIIIDEYGMGAFSMIVVENKTLKDTAKLEAEIESIPHVKDVLWYDDIADLSLPVEMIPAQLREKFFSGNATMLLTLLDNSTSSDDSMEAVDRIRDILDDNCYASGMTATLNDLRDLTDAELPIYILIAVLLCLAVMLLLTDSFVVPFLFLFDIGCAIIYNMGSNVLFGEISYITKAVAAVLQLGVTTDYSIFLLDSYRENLQRFPGESNRAMGHAIANTFKSIVGGSVTTIAGFIALCFMTFTLGIDMGLVMTKGVLLGVLSCVTILPSLVLIFEPLIRKTKHRPLLANTDRFSDFVTKHSRLWLVIFAVLLFPAIWGNTHVGVYYDMLGTLPDSLPSRIAQAKMRENFDSSTMHMLLMDKNIPAKEKKAMFDEISETDGVSWCLGLNSLVDPSIPDEMIPEKIRGMLQSGDYELAFISTPYDTGTDEVNAQIDKINEIVKRYDTTAMVIGEAPLTHDLVDITDIDFRNVNGASLLIIFVIIALVFRSLSLPFILELTIEFAIMINMAIPYYAGSKICFVTSIILGTVQLGSTVDYAILMTSRYQKERQRGFDKHMAARKAHRACTPSIITSACAFFAATFGVAVYSNIDIIQSICMMLARGALISMVTVIFVLPGMFELLDSLICRTSFRFLGTAQNRQKKTPADTVRTA